MKAQQSAKAREFMSKAWINAGAGLPINSVLNIVILPWTAPLWTQNIWLALLATMGPYIIASVVRQWVIDWVLYRYGVNVDPSYYIKKWLVASKPT